MFESFTIAFCFPSLCRIFIITKFFYAYAIFASFLLQFYVPMDFLEPAFYGRIKVDRLEHRFPRHHKKLAHLIQMLFRSVIVILIGNDGPVEVVCARYICASSLTSIICARERSLVLVNVKDLQRVLVKRLGGKGDRI